MALTSIEIIAALFAVIALIKIVVIVINRRWWYKHVTNPIYGNPAVSGVIFAVLAIIILYFLLQELSIVQIFAVLAFAGILIALGFLPYWKIVGPALKKRHSQGFNGWQWLYIIIWFLLVLWVLYAIFLA